jgi:hypothetical protein
MKNTVRLKYFQQVRNKRNKKKRKKEKKGVLK